MNKLGNKFIIIGMLLIGSSFGLFIYNDYEEINAGRKSNEVLEIIQNNFVEDKTDTIVYENVEEVIEMKTINVNGYDYIGTIKVPSLNLELPVMSGYDYDKLKISPCRYYGSIYTDDLIICAHSYKTHFKYLIDLDQGDKVIFTDASGISYVYEVLEIEILNSDDVSEMINNDFDLTLYTCTSDGLSRVTVRCNRVNESI